MATEYEPNGKAKVERHEVDYDYTYYDGDGWTAHCTCGKSRMRLTSAYAEQAIKQHAADMNRKLDA